MRPVAEELKRPRAVAEKSETVDASWVPVWFARSRYAEPSIPSKVPVQAPVRSRVRAPAVFVRPEPVRSVKVSAFRPKLVVVAFVEEALVAKIEEKMLCAPHELAVVVPKARVNAPVPELYASGYAAESEEEEILLLKEVKSAEERYPFTPVVA